MKNIGNRLVMVLSLGLGLAAAMILIAKVRFELSYDGCYPSSSDIYVIESTFKYASEGDGESKTFGQVSGGVAPGFQDGIPEVVAGTRMTSVVGSNINRDEDGNIIKGEMMCTDTSFFRVFQWPILAGDPADALVSWNAGIMVSRSFAGKLGGVEAAMGKVIHNQDIPAIDLTVKGVYEDFPETSSFNDLDILLSVQCMGGWSVNNWFGNDRYIGYVRLSPGTDPKSLADDIRKVQEAHQDMDELKAAGVDLGYELESLQKEHRDEKRSAIIILSVTAILLLLVSVLNYILVAIGDVLRRSKEVGVRKCYGASPSSIYGIFIRGAAVNFLASLLVSAGLVLMFGQEIESLMGVPVDGLLNRTTVAWLIAIAALVFVVSAVIPAHMFARVPISSAFRGYHEHKRRWKLSLLAFQFAINGLMLVLLMVVSAQYRRAVNDDPGYDYENLAYVSLTGIDNEKRWSVAEALKRLPYVEGAAISWGLPFQGSSGDNVSLPGHDETLFNAADQYEATSDFFDLFGLKMLEGRQPALSNEVAVSRSFSSKLQGMTGWPDGVVGKQIDITGHDIVEFTISGVYEDYMIGNLLEEDPRPSMRFVAKPDSTAYASMPQLVVRLSEITAGNMQGINDILVEMLPDAEAQFSSYAESIAKCYSETHKMQRTYALGAIFALIVALFGLVGYVQDENSRRSKEVAIRKVNGAVSSEIVKMLVGGILKISIPSLIAGNIGAWFVAHGFLQQFSRSVRLGAWYFIVADVVILAVIVSTVVIGSLRVANGNPVESLKNE